MKKKKKENKIEGDDRLNEFLRKRGHAGGSKRQKLTHPVNTAVMGPVVNAHVEQNTDLLLNLQEFFFFFWTNASHKTHILDCHSFRECT